jgi:hypothetical protein
VEASPAHQQAASEIAGRIETGILQLLVQFFEVCAGRAVLRRLVVQSSAGGIDRLAGYCGNVINSTPGAPIIVSSGFEHFLPGHGGYGGAETIDTCPVGGALVGIRVGTKGWVRTVRGICTTDASSWSTGQTSATTLLSQRGSGATSFQTAQCPRRSFLIGWRIKTGQFVDSIRAQCRLFEIAGQAQLSLLLIEQAADLTVDHVSCGQEGLTFRISYIGDQVADRFMARVLFEQRTEEGRPTLYSQEIGPFSLGPVEETDANINIPLQCFAEEEPRGCDISIQVDARDQVIEVDKTNNIIPFGLVTCGAP